MISHAFKYQKFRLELSVSLHKSGKRKDGLYQYVSVCVYVRAYIVKGITKGILCISESSHEGWEKCVCKTKENKLIQTKEKIHNFLCSTQISSVSQVLNLNKDIITNSANKP